MNTHDLTTFLYRTSPSTSWAAAREAKPKVGRARAVRAVRTERSSFMVGRSPGGAPASNPRQVVGRAIHKDIRRNRGRRRVKGHYRHRMTVRSTGHSGIPQRFTLPRVLPYPWGAQMADAFFRLDGRV